MAERKIKHVKNTLISKKGVLKFQSSFLHFLMLAINFPFEKKIATKILFCGKMVIINTKSGRKYERFL